MAKLIVFLLVSARHCFLIGRRFQFCDGIQDIESSTRRWCVRGSWFRRSEWAYVLWNLVRTDLCRSSRVYTCSCSECTLFWRLTRIWLSFRFREYCRDRITLFPGRNTGDYRRTWARSKQGYKAYGVIFEKRAQNKGIQIKSRKKYTHTHTNTCAHVHAQTHACIHVQRNYTCTHNCIHTHTHKRMHTHAHAHIHAQTHSYMHVIHEWSKCTDIWWSVVNYTVWSGSCSCT